VFSFLSFSFVFNFLFFEAAIYANKDVYNNNLSRFFDFFCNARAFGALYIYLSAPFMLRRRQGCCYYDVIVAIKQLPSASESLL